MISVEISYYPLETKLSKPINEFIDELSNSTIEYKIGSMSTVLTGEYDLVMDFLKNSIKKLMGKYPSVFNLKISNSCPV